MMIFLCENFKTYRTAYQAGISVYRHGGKVYFFAGKQDNNPDFSPCFLFL